MEKKKNPIKKFKTEFSNFAFKEATLGTAVGIMLGSSFKDVINSLVNDILTPPIAHVTSGIDFTEMYFVFSREAYSSLEEAREAGELVIQYGNFINEFISFLITAFFLFLIAYQGTKLINKMNEKDKKKEVEKKKKCPYCLSDIEKKATRCPYCTSKLN